MLKVKLIYNIYMDNYNDGDLCNYALTEEIIVSKKNPMCLDIGADKGDWGLFVLKKNPTARILMFEPNPISFATLKTKVDDYSTITSYNLAVSAKAGSLQLTLEECNSNSRGGNAETTVECVSLGDYIKEYIEIIKIDTEGHELIIIESLFPFIERGLVGSIVTEFSVFWYGQSIKDCFTNTSYILEKMLQYYKYCYSLSRRGDPTLFGPIKTEQLQEFILDHYNNHLQTDLYFTNEEPKTVTVREYSINYYN